MSGQIIFREKVPEIVPEVPKFTNLKKVNFQNYLTQLFVDDLVISPSLRLGYKEKLDPLEKHCRKWELNLNLKKTKVVIFLISKGILWKINFYYREKEIEISRQYTYLCFTFVLSGENMLALKTSLRKARRHGFQYKKYEAKSKEQQLAHILAWRVFSETSQLMRMWMLGWFYEERNFCKKNWIIPYVVNVKTNTWC